MIKSNLFLGGALLLAASVNGKNIVKPNTVLINIDDLGWTDLSCNGSTYYETPNVDHLKSLGIWFGNAYAGGANSSPSRACMLTGQNSPRHGVYTVNPSDRGDAKKRKLISFPNRKVLPDGIQILPKALKDAGYTTYHIGKWHVTDSPEKCGFDVNIAGNHAGMPHTYFSPYRNPNLKDGEKGEFLTDRLGDEAVNIIKTADNDKPFFLYYATYAVHVPLQAPEYLVKKYEKKKKTKAHSNPVYAALVESMDRNVGKLLDAIEKSGKSGNTLIIFTSDNGGFYNVSKQWPLRAGKGSFYEGGIRIPLIIYMKGKFENREISDVNVSQLDFFPTLMELAGVHDNELLLDGKSLLPLLENNDKSQFAERPLFWHFPAYLEGGNKETRDKYFRSRPVSVIRKGDWKLIENYEDNSIELYNIKTDIGEKHDLSESNSVKVQELKTALDEWKKNIGAPCIFKLNPDFQEENVK